MDERCLDERAVAEQGLDVSVSASVKHGFDDAVGWPVVLGRASGYHS